MTKTPALQLDNHPNTKHLFLTLTTQISDTYQHQHNDLAPQTFINTIWKSLGLTDGLV